MAETKELPDPVRARLKPSLKKLYSRLPAHISSQVAKLVDKAQYYPVNPNRLVKYALLLVTSERELAGAEISREHTARARAELTGQQHGLSEGYQQSEDAWRHYRLGRRAQQRLHASLDGLWRRWKQVAQVIRDHRADVSMHLQIEVSDEKLKTVGDTLERMYHKMSLEPQSSQELPRNPSESTRSIHTFFLWQRFMPNYRGKWKDMHDLALTWKLTTADTPQNFRLIARKGCKRIEAVHVPLSPAWIAALSEDP